MSEQHTKEPWKVSGTEHIVANGNYVVALDCKPEDASRIVACVNACAGIPTDDLEQCQSGGLFHLADYSNELVKQRDELLVALRPLITSRMGAEQIREGIQKAIASVKANTK